ncbi:hypothetical protein PACTADRAFT_19070 [Pachysolen tannophilus NRRL Y-2460]|uniref:UBR-type domain-containing protein n=1 Tax=Pachysolen tannophilus NRRL Y-2460 TaxID=669874 RepID=A0A1E4TMT9_PACTA|nr:hypothetical protein PACTADRAFT_19070 [Pachysolen tannophilus NRRL Y-2460]
MKTIKEESCLNDGARDGEAIDSMTAVEYLRKTARIVTEKEARELMPYDPNICTYTIGALHQQVYACLTCRENDTKKPLSGICYSCSIQCHSSHELVELFSKRDFTCDCGTTRMKYNGGCRLRNRPSTRRSSFASQSLLDLNGNGNNNGNGNSTNLPAADDIPSSSNCYNQNFKGFFCSCEKPYNPLEETGNMFQCHFGEVCGEDWYHDECIMGFKPGFMGDRRKTPKNSSDKNERGVNLLDKLAAPGSEAGADNLIPKEKNLGLREDQLEEKEAKESKGAVKAAEIVKDENDSYDENSNDDDDDDAIPIPGFPALDDFDCFICWKCIERFKDAFEEIPDDIILPKLYHIDASSIEERNSKLSLKVKKEHGQDLGNEHDSLTSSKRRKVDTTFNSKYPYSIFLQENFKQNLKNIMLENKPHHSRLIKLLRTYPYLYSNDPVYEPEPDQDIQNEDDSSSIYNLGSQALNTLPREKAIEGMRAYENIKNRLSQFLKPFADEGKVVTEQEVRDFFKKAREDQGLD